jgi:hypothetical protein
MNSLINPRWFLIGLNKIGSGMRGSVIILKTKGKSRKAKLKNVWEIK